MIVETMQIGNATIRVHDDLKSIERVNRDSEYFKQNAIPYLEQYVDSLKEAGRKTVVLEDKQ